MSINLVEADLSTLATNDVSYTHGDPISVRKEFDNDKWKKPEHIYLIYLRVNDDQTLEVQHLFDEIGRRGLAQAESDLLEEARPHRPKTHVFAYGMDVIDFRDKPCFVTIILDERNWHFHPHPYKINSPAIVLRRNKIVVQDVALAVLEEYDMNYTFYNYEMGHVKDAEGDQVQAVKFVSFNKKDRFGSPEYKREDLNDKPEQEKQNRYSFDIYLRMPIRPIQGELVSKWLTVVFDPATPPRY